MEIDRKSLIKKYVEFFKKKKHKHIPSASLIPENDPTVLFTTAGMHPLVPFLLGAKHPLGKRLVSVQKCIRTGDIEEVGDKTHHTFFEMLGNWSLGDYWKKEAINYSFEFLTKELGISKKDLEVTCFKGDKDSPKDTESEKIWKSLGISKINFLGKKDNWWGPAGKTGPCGPDTEMFVNGVEIWNDVFMEYVKDKRLIWVDGMHCIYDKNFKLNKKLLNLINGFNTHTILVVNNHREKGFELVKKNSPGLTQNWMAFSLEKQGIKKDNSKYFETLMKKFNLVPEEIVYFDHDKKNVETAKKLGILSIHYSEDKSIKKFIENNLWAFIPAKQKNVDTGMGVERTLAILNNLDDNYLTDSFFPIIKKIEKISNKKYKESSEDDKRCMRIIADHIRTSVFILGDDKGIVPSNTDQGYVLRRLIRRALRFARQLEIKEKNFLSKLAKVVIKEYTDYQELSRNHKKIIEELDKEEERFLLTLEKGLRKFEEISKDGVVSGKEAFLLFQSFGFPIEMSQELADEKGIKIDLEEYNLEFKRHQDLSRSASMGKFKSGLADDSEMTKKLHTATHLLNETLRVVLRDKNIKQKGSNITPERLRFDFNFDRKLTKEELEKVEQKVNEIIGKGLEITREEMPLEEALGSGAQSEFGAKYPEMVSVYTIHKSGKKDEWYSREICTGPHVSNTKELGKFKIKKEESSSAGVRRIKAVLE